jgi:hypothetical protein
MMRGRRLPLCRKLLIKVCDFSRSGLRAANGACAYGYAGASTLRTTRQ